MFTHIQLCNSGMDSPFHRSHRSLILDFKWVLFWLVDFFFFGGRGGGRGVLLRKEGEEERRSRSLSRSI